MSDRYNAMPGSPDDVFEEAFEHEDEELPEEDDELQESFEDESEDDDE